MKSPFLTRDGRPRWALLRHAYGRASDVPAIIDALRSGEARLIEDAVNDGLWGALWHQGTVYSATVFAIPFLIDLAADESVSVREEILYFLLECAKAEHSLGGAYSLITLVAPHSQAFPTIRTAICRGRDIYRRLETSSDPLLSSRATSLVAYCDLAR